MEKKKTHPHKGDLQHKGHEAVEPVVSDEQSEGVAQADDVVQQLKEALSAKEAEAAANWEKFVRERADLENYRKRTQKEKEELLKYGNENLLLEILPVLDNMERALAHSVEESQAGVVEGVKLTHGMLLAALKKFGVVPLEVTRGTGFDPALHHAVHQSETEDIPPNTIAEVLQGGYLLNDRLLRPAMVSVAVAPEKNRR